MSEEIPQELTAKEAAGMTVNERLSVAGLVTAYDEAIRQNDVDGLRNVLQRIYLGEKSIDANISFAFKRK